MNSYERTIKTIKNKETDRVPVIPLIIQYAMKKSGITHRDYSTNPESLVKAQTQSLFSHGYDGIHITSDNLIISEAMGCKVHLPPDETPQCKYRVLKNEKNINKLKEVDPKKSGRMPVMLEATKIAHKKLGDEYFIKSNFDSAPFSLAASLRGEEQFFIDLYESTEFVFELLEICKDIIISYGKELAKCGAHALTFGDATAGIIGRKNYKKFALPFAKKVITELKKFNLPIFYHICGDATNILDLMADTGADVLEIDSQVSLAKALKQLGNHVCLEGNIDTISTLLQGAPEKVSDESLNAINIFNGKGLILSAGCEVPRNTPPKNIDEMVAASKKFNYK